MFSQNVPKLEIYEFLYYTFSEVAKQFYIYSMLKVKGVDRSVEIILRHDTDRDAVRF